MKPGAAPRGKASPGEGIEAGDHVYIQHPQRGPLAVKVTAKGKDGFTARCDQGARHRLPFDRVLGHKARMAQAYEVEEEGADGAIVRDARGGRRFLAGGVPPPPAAPKPAAAPTDDPITDGMDRLAKATPVDLSKPILFIKAGALANRPGLALRDYTDRSGKHSKHWVRSVPEASGEPRRRAAPEVPGKETIDDSRQTDLEDFTGPPMKHGQVVGFRHGDVAGEGKIVASGKDGVTLQDDGGREHQVRHEHLTGPAGAAPPGGGGKGGGGGDGDDGGDGPKVPPADKMDSMDARPSSIGKKDAGGFSAAAHFAEHDKADAATVEAVLSGFPPDTADKIAAARERLAGITETKTAHQKGGQYTPERQKLHQQITDHFLSDEKVAGATPPEGQAPSFTILGGRGGSGKSKLKGVAYDPAKAIVLDADEIKGMLPEYKGWNAAEVHEESGDIFDAITQAAMALGLNIVHDATMKTPAKAVGLVKGFKEAGYRTEAHYMHLPRAEAARRAVSRFLGPTGRFVPPEVILGNTQNETAFDQVKELVDAWSFRDNQGEGSAGPKLIAEHPARGEAGGAVGGDAGQDGRDGRPAPGAGDGRGSVPPPAKDDGGALRKALNRARVFFRRVR